MKNRSHTIQESSDDQWRPWKGLVTSSYSVHTAQNIALVIIEVEAEIGTGVVCLRAHTLNIGKFAKICQRVTRMAQQSQNESVHL